MNTWNRHYPRLSEQDIALLLDFQADHFGLYTNWEYDLRIGTGRDPGTDFDPAIRKMAIMLSQRRIDAVAEHRDHIAIFEITQTAEHRPLSQIMLYTNGYRDLKNPTKPILPYILCRQISGDILQECQNHGCRVHIYPAESIQDKDLGHPPTT